MRRKDGPASKPVGQSQDAWPRNPPMVNRRDVCWLQALSQTPAVSQRGVMHMEIFIFWFLLAIGVGLLANSRGRSGFGFFLVAVVLSPLLGLIIVLVTENKTKVAEQAERDRLEHQRRLEEVKAITAAPAAAVATIARAGASVADELRKLADLRDAGVLTPAEFEKQKSRLLGIEAPAPAPTQNVPAPMGVCSNCKTPTPMNAEECTKCRVILGPDSSYKVLPQ